MLQKMHRSYVHVMAYTSFCREHEIKSSILIFQLAAYVEQQNKTRVAIVACQHCNEH